MKQYKYLYSKCLTDKVIDKAYKSLRKGKTKRAEIRYIDEHYAEEKQLMKNMIFRTQPKYENCVNSGFHSQTITPKFIQEHGKLRKIYQPEIHEQWLHHIIIAILGPIIMNLSYPWSCGSFPKRGLHMAKKHIEKILHTQSKRNKYFFKADIRHFYDHIRKNILVIKLTEYIKDDLFVYLIMRCLENFKKGLPLGFYISQWLANFYLNSLDHFIANFKRISIYVRYMDDIVITGSKWILKKIQRVTGKYLCKFLHLKYKRNYQIRKYKKDICIDFMGFQFFKNRVIIRKNIMLSIIRLLKKIHIQKCRRRQVYAMVSYMGWAKNANMRLFYINNIRPIVNIGQCRNIISQAA